MLSQLSCELQPHDCNQRHGQRNTCGAVTLTQSHALKAFARPAVKAAATVRIRLQAARASCLGRRRRLPERVISIKLGPMYESRQLLVSYKAASS